MDMDLDELARLADCDLRTVATYYSSRRDQMRPRVKARIERALVAMRQARKGRARG